MGRRTSIEIAALILLVFGFSPRTPAQSGSQTTPPSTSPPSDVRLDHAARLGFFGLQQISRRLHRNPFAHLAYLQDGGHPLALPDGQIGFREDPGLESTESH